MIFVLLLSGINGEAYAQSNEGKLPTVKVAKKKKKPREAKEVKKPIKIKDAYKQPASVGNSSKAKDNYQRPASKGKKKKHRDNYQQPASKTLNYNNSPYDAPVNNEPAYEEGQDKPRESFWQRTFNRNKPSTFQGRLKRKKEIEGTEGTDYQGTIKRKKVDYEQLAKDQHLYQGNIRRAPQKRVDKQFQYKAEYMNFYSGGIRIAKPKRQIKINERQSSDLQSAGMYKVKKEKDKAASYTSYHGQIKVPTLKARTRHFKKLSAKVHQYDGDIRMRKPGKDMHPSVYHLKGKTMRSYEQKEQYRRWRLIISHIFKKNDLPKSAKEKERKPRYDKEESEIWYY
ncbi:hypothetical protein PZB74_16660 [Porifericola rhodea]|uniref:hypothetical protein n=1 Tax=Porifericola rhodea TaxID=930972 RepID=UPI002666ECDA|nr:hypothetical protein [Porifericola rhodea]WKN30596.1 hypothetical protein PZB74_16660 [Porifericola rhodea]